MWSNEYRKTTIAKYKNVLLKINYTDTWANVSYWFRIAVSFARLEEVDRRFRLEKSLAQIREMRGWLRKWEFSTIDRQRVCLFAPELIYLFHQTVAVCVFLFSFLRNGEENSLTNSNVTTFMTDVVGVLINHLTTCECLCVCDCICVFTCIISKNIRFATSKHDRFTDEQTHSVSRMTHVNYIFLVVLYMLLWFSGI